MPRLCHSSSSSTQVFDLQDGRQVCAFQAAADTINGVAFNPSLPLLATASGHRRYPLLPEDGWEGAAGDSGDSAAAAHGSSAGDVTMAAANAAAGAAGGDDEMLTLSSYKEGGSCNALRLWRVQAEWLPLAAAPGVEDAGGAGDEQAAAEAVS